MFKEFLRLNRKAILPGFKKMVIVLFIISLGICTMLFYNGEIPSLILYLLTIMGVSLGLPILFATIIGLRWTWDMNVYKNNFNSFPFCDLEKIGFRKVLLNQNSKRKLVEIIYRGELNGFIIDIDTDTQHEYKYLRFRFSQKPRPENIKDFDFNTMSIEDPKFVSGFSKILTKYHRKKHNLKSIKQLENELKNITEKLNKKPEFLMPGHNNK